MWRWLFQIQVQVWATISRCRNVLNIESASRDEGICRMPSRISARNQIKGKVTKVTKDTVLASVEIEVQGPVRITSVITSNSAEDLNLKVGDSVSTIIKSTEVMIGKE